MNMEKLAIYGGRPTRETYLPYGRQTVNNDDIDSVVKALKGDYLTTGPYLKEFEEKAKEIMRNAASLVVQLDVSSASGDNMAELKG